MKRVSAVPVLQIAGAYTALDCAGALLTFADAAASSNGYVARLRRVHVKDNASISAEFTLYLFSASPTAAARTDADIFAPADADAALILDSVAVATADYFDQTANSFATVEVDKSLQLTSSGSLYGVIVLVGTPTFIAATDLTITLEFE